MKMLPVIAVVVVVGLGLVAYAVLGKSSSAPTATASPQPSPTAEAMTQLEGTTASPDIAMEAIDEVAYDVTLDSFSFSPNKMEAKAGETIKVKLTNKEGFHDFVIDELNVASSKLAEGKSEIIEITVPAGTAAGTTYEYYCSVGNHRQQGMVGTLTVK
jgi:plastocyanin